METVIEKPSKQLKELIIINNDRYEGYKTAGEETKDSDLKTLFDTYSNQSKKFSDELQHMLPDNNFAPSPNETRTTGKLYRTFMDIKAAMAGKNRKAILSSCEYGEDTIKKTYDDVLENIGEISKETAEVIRKQRAELQKSHDKIKAMRDSA